jgi:hypothetical protein
MLTSISPCPLATNITAIAYISKELKIFIRDNLIKDLQELERIRKKVMRKLISYCSVAVIITIAFLSIIFMAGFTGVIGYLHFVVIGLVSVFAMIYTYVIRHYVSDYKESIIRKIVKFVDKSLHYQKENKIPLALYNKSKLFTKKLN